MFWGLTLEPGRLYTETMGEEVQLSMAAIDSRKDMGESPCSTNFCQIVIQTEKGEYVLCTLVHGVMFQQSLDLKLMPREKVTFSVQGPSVVYLVGYTASYPEDEEEMRMQQEDYEDSSAWEAFEEGEHVVNQVKHESGEREMLGAHNNTDAETDDRADIERHRESGSHDQVEGAPTDEAAHDSGDEIIFAVAEIDQTVVKTEPPDPDSGLPDTTPGGMTPSEHKQQLSPRRDIDRTQLSEHDRRQTSTSQDFSQQEMAQQQQKDYQLTPPVAFQPINSGPDSHQQNPPAGTLQNYLLQRSHVGPIRNSSPRPPTQRTYPAPRRQYGTNRSQPASKAVFDQLRDVMKAEQQQGPMAGPSRVDLSGPSSRGTGERTSSPNPEPAPFVDTGAGENSQRKPNGADGISLASAKAPPVNAAEKATSGSLGEETAAKDLARSGKSVPKNVPLGSTLFCRHCGKKFTDRVKYRAHEYQHTRERRFQCSFCHKCFRSSEHRINHERVHTGERPFTCQYCQKSFTRKFTCRKHEKKHFKDSGTGSHQDAGERPMNPTPNS